MGKHVKVRFLGRDGVTALVTKDLEVGKVYSAYMPDADEKDKDGYPVLYGEYEYWLTDEVGDAIVVNGSNGFKLVEDIV